MRFLPPSLLLPPLGWRTVKRDVKDRVTAMSGSLCITANIYMAVPKLGECCRQVEADEVSNSRNKIHQTMYKQFFRALYMLAKTISF